MFGNPSCDILVEIPLVGDLPSDDADSELGALNLADQSSHKCEEEGMPFQNEAFLLDASVA